MKYKVQLALGTNLGDKEKNLFDAKQLLKQKIGNIVEETSHKKTKPWGYESKNEYLNMIVIIETILSPIKLLHKIKEIEIQMGRQQNINNNNNTYQDRIIDVDILYYKGMNFRSKKLNIPHSKIAERIFFNFFWYKS